MSKLYKSLLYTLFNFLVLYQPFSCIAQGAVGALQFDGINNYVEFSNHNRGMTNEVTVEAWIKTNSTGHHHVVSKYDRDAERGFQLLIQNGRACLAGRDGSGSYRLSGYSSTFVADNQWHHLAGVVREGTWKIFVDGVLQNQLRTGYSSTILANNENLLLGNYYYIHLGNHYYKGQVDEVRVWKKGLTEEEIRQNMCRSLASSTPDLTGYFKLDNITNGEVIDHSPQKLNGSLTNMNYSTAWVISGAPIGDQSVYRYTTKWESSLEMVTDYANFSVTKVDPAINGFHLYSIQSPPATTNGIGTPGEVKEYYGLFKVGAADKKYKVYFKQYGMDCGGLLYRRKDNSGTNWNVVADTTSSPIMLYTTSANYGEYAATSQSAPSVKITSSGDFCPGSTATLTASYQGRGKILWNTGETPLRSTSKRAANIGWRSLPQINVRQGMRWRFSSAENPSSHCQKKFTLVQAKPLRWMLQPTAQLIFGAMARQHLVSLLVLPAPTQSF